MICTIIEQSQRLLEVGIKPETADMYYKYVLAKSSKIHHVPDIGNPINALKWYNEGYTFKGRNKPIDLNDFCIPAWSLTSLWDLIPVQIITDKIHLRLRMDKGENDFSIWYDDFNGCCVYEDADFTCENPIDAAVEMIEWLYENGYLGKEELK